MRIIGITGPSGSGKTVLTSKISTRGHRCIDADELYHSMLIPPSKCLDALRLAFGNGIFCDNGTIDRRALGAIVFADQKKLELLNSTVLSIVIERIHEMIDELSLMGVSTVVIDAPTLIESGFDKECDEVISVISPRDIRILRIAERDGISHQAAKERVDAQKSDEFYRAASDFVIYNNGDIQTFEAKALDLLQILGL